MTFNDPAVACGAIRPRGILPDVVQQQFVTDSIDSKDWHASWTRQGGEVNVVSSQ